MLLDQHARGQHVGRVARQHRHARLRHDRPCVQFRRDVMDGAAVLHASFGQGPLVGVQAPEVGQERGVDIEDASPPRLDELAG